MGFHVSLGECKPYVFLYNPHNLPGPCSLQRSVGAGVENCVHEPEFQLKPHYWVAVKELKLSYYIGETL